MENDIFKQEKYDLPKEEYIEFAPGEGGEITETELKEKESSAPDLFTAPKMEILRYAAKKGMQIDLVDPDQSCSRCHGLGYTGIDTATHMPLACKCVFPNPVNNRRIEKLKLRAEKKGITQNV